MTPQRGLLEFWKNTEETESSRHDSRRVVHVSVHIVLAKVSHIIKPDAIRVQRFDLLQNKDTNPLAPSCNRLQKIKPNKAFIKPVSLKHTQKIVSSYLNGLLLEMLIPKTIRVCNIPVQFYSFHL